MQKNRTLFVCVLLLTVICSPLCASVTGGVDGLLSAGTNHFDIIYKPESIETAALVFENCEDIYTSLVNFFGADPDLHVPVVITDEFKILNAYYSSFPANRIVLFDTVAPVGQLSNFEQTILSIFRHELTHAFQFNYRSRFSRFLSDVFGDVVSPSPVLYMYPSLSEGGAVFSESQDGYGRINDAYAMQIVRQAKIEGQFPDWIDIAGARDTYPSGLLYYNFAAAFLDYLSMQYGSDAVAGLYVDFGTSGWFSDTEKLIEKRIGISVEQAWQYFFLWVNTPEELALAQDVQCRADYGYYSNLTMAKDGYLYAYDMADWSVLRFSPGKKDCRTILTLPTNNPELCISEGGLLLIPYVMEGETSVRLYSLTDRKTKLLNVFCSDDKDIRSGCIVNVDGTDYALLYSNNGQRTYLDLYGLSDYQAVEDMGIELGYGVVASEFCALDNGLVAFLVSYQAKDYVAVLDAHTMDVTILDNPVNAALRSLSLGSVDGRQVLGFTWIDNGSSDGSMLRYGELVVSDGYKVRLSQTDVSGGMSGAVRANDEIVFIAEYYDHKVLQTIKTDSLDFSEEYELGTLDVISIAAPSTLALEGVSHDYRPGKYFRDGVLVPMGLASFGTMFQDAGFGLTWITMDPTETYMHRLSAGLGMNGPFIAYGFDSSNHVIPYSVYAQGSYILNDSYVTSQIGSFCLEAGAATEFTFNLRHMGEYVSVSDKFDASFLMGEDFRMSIINNLNLTYGYSHRTGTNPFDSFGFGVTGFLYNITPSVGIFLNLPKLLWWIDCDGADVANLPSKFTLSGVFGNRGMDYLVGSAKILLRSHEIQDGVSFLNMYCRRSTLELGYDALYDLAYGEFGNNLSLSWMLHMTPVLGEYLTKLDFALGASMTVNPVVGDIYFTIGFGTDWD